ncbi:hypothetical protein LINGRAPRIM_LOCUS3095 [Linum grandiflorum]
MLSHLPPETQSPSHPAAALGMSSLPAGSTVLSPPSPTSNFRRRLCPFTWPTLNSSSRWALPYKRWLSYWGAIRLARPTARNFKTGWLISWEPDSPTQVWTRLLFASSWSHVVVVVATRLQLWIRGRHFHLMGRFIGRSGGRGECWQSIKSWVLTRLLRVWFRDREWRN